MENAILSNDYEQVVKLNAEKAKRISQKNLLTYLSKLPVENISHDNIDWEITKKGMSITITIPRGEMEESLVWELKPKK